MLLRTTFRFRYLFGHRLMSTEVKGEQKISKILRDKYPNALLIEVEDVSGGSFSILFSSNFLI